MSINPQELPASSTGELTQSPASTYLIVGDNVDKAIQPHDLRSDGKGKQLLHYFHYFASSNRIDTSELSVISPPPPIHLTYNDCALSLLPSVHDDEALRHNFSIIISRILATHLETFKFSFGDIVQWHIPHKYAEEMSKKSEVVSYNIFHVQQLNKAKGTYHHSS